MIVAGIDEAGYGPRLGPLVVGCCAFEIPVPDPAELPPCLWKMLRKCVSRNRIASGKRLHINDSKQVYSPSQGLKELERGVLCLLSAMRGPVQDLAELLEILALDVLTDLPEYPWYSAIAGERFPIEQESASISVMTNALQLEMNRCGVRCSHMAARVVLERQLNRQLDATRNKATTLFSTSAIHLDQLLRRFGRQNLLIFCDRQGGREHYGDLLRQMFDQWSLTIVAEDEGRCEYHLEQDGHRVRIFFREKAEECCLATALASMISKYVREALMRRFNAFWLGHMPGLAPTAGYYGDGTRFLRDIEQKRRELGIEDRELIRMK